MANSKYIKNVDKLIAKLELRRRKSVTDKGSVTVGTFGVRYALYVHENMEAYHHVGSAKFLERAYRKTYNQTVKTVLRGFKSGLTLVQALAAGGRLIQRESMKLTPVDTGNLKASHDTRVESK